MRSKKLSRICKQGLLSQRWQGSDSRSQPSHNSRLLTTLVAFIANFRLSEPEVTPGFFGHEMTKAAHAKADDRLPRQRHAARQEEKDQIDGDDHHNSEQEPRGAVRALLSIEAYPRCLQLLHEIGALDRDCCE